LVKIPGTEGRALSVKVNCNLSDKSLLITCVSFPCSDTAANYKASVGLLQAYIFDMLESIPSSLHLIGGDFNFPCHHGDFGFENFMSSCASKFNLSCCDNLVTTTDISTIYTYFHKSLNQKSWVDHFFISDGLRNFVSQFTVVDSGDNLSDHLPISCLLSYNVHDRESFSESNCGMQMNSSMHYVDRWDKADIMLYYYLSGCYLQQIVVPKDILLSDYHSDNHFELIDDYYNAIKYALTAASFASVPKIKHSALKAFWNEDLDDLK